MKLVYEGAPYESIDLSWFFFPWVGEQDGYMFRRSVIGYYRARSIIRAQCESLGNALSEMLRGPLGN